MKYQDYMYEEFFDKLNRIPCNFAPLLFTFDIKGKPICFFQNPSSIIGRFDGESGKRKWKSGHSGSECRNYRRTELAEVYTSQPGKFMHRIMLNDKRLFHGQAIDHNCNFLPLMFVCLCVSRWSLSIAGLL